MPKLGCLGWGIIGTLVFVILAVLSMLLFPVPQPEVHLEAETIFGLPFFTNTLFASLLTILVLVVIFFTATRNMKLVPGRWQNVVEWVMEWFLNFCEEAAGRENGRRFFPVVATIFLYVIGAALISLIPGFEVFGYGHAAPPEGVPGAFVGTYHGFIVDVPILKKANTDINFPLALALISFIFVEFMGIRSLGFFRYISRFFSVSELFKGIGELFRGRIRAGLGGIFTGIIEIFVGIIETISEFIRIVSLTFRLFGNMTAGMILLLIICFLVPWVVGVPFYGLEALFGFVQALIFGGLTLVFATIAVTPRAMEE